MLFYGSDGAAAWQGFVQEKGQAIGRHSICDRVRKQWTNAFGRRKIETSVKCVIIQQLNGCP